MTLLWFVVWIIADHVGSHEPLRFDPVNAWAWTLILAVALDLGAAHARNGSKRSCEAKDEDATASRAPRS